MRMALFLILSIGLLLSGCASTDVYKDVFSQKSSCNSQEFPVSKDVIYQAAVRAICSKNFIIENENPQEGFILAKRSFQKGKRTIALLLQAKIVPEGDGKSVLYLNALQTKERLYVADRTRFFLFIIPLPGGGGKEATKIKEGESIVTDKKFYKDFFALIKKEIRNE